MSDMFDKSQISESFDVPAGCTSSTLEMCDGTLNVSLSDATGLVFSNINLSVRLHSPFTLRVSEDDLLFDVCHYFIILYDFYRIYFRSA